MLSPSTGLKGCQRVNQVRGQNKLNIPLSKCIKRKPEAPGEKKKETTGQLQPNMKDALP